MANLLEVRDLKVEFQLHQQGAIEAVKGVSFRVKPGSTVALVGESGSGKSVISQCIMGILPDVAHITGGSILLRDDAGAVTDIARLPPDGKQMRDIRGGRISMIFQEPMTSLSPLHTVGSQIEEAVRLHRPVGSAEAVELAADMLRMVGFPEPARALKTYPFELSGGLRQRAMIAMAISCRPQLLIADEPSTALDVTIQAQVLELLAGLRVELNMAIILITHDLAVVAGFCDHVAVMYAGHIVEHASVHDLFRRSLHPYTLGLLGSVPSRIGDRTKPLITIPGAPPDQTALPPGCPYAVRCTYVRDECHLAVPELTRVDSNHSVRCLVDVSTGELR
ncbi:MAG: ABC transporter ATP-binding protein [Chromatiales bacterium]|nr:ABC transporter ATP-binding protein [Chromatiales bacterium]